MQGERVSYFFHDMFFDAETQMFKNLYVYACLRVSHSIYR